MKSAYLRANLNGVLAAIQDIAIELLLLLAPALLTAQILPSFQSVQIHPDRTVTFRYRDVHAAKVLFVLEGTAQPLPMAKDAAGVWTITTPPLAPEIYRYHFEIDGISFLDPANPVISNSLARPASMVTVPAGTPELWDLTDVPHGAIDRHIYTTSAVIGLPDNQSEYYVYTPPGYDQKSNKLYPVLYLLHGWTDSDLGWIANGKLNLIFDNLLAQGKIKPMIVVMPLGYGDMSFIHSPFDVWRTPSSIDHNTTLFTRAFLTEIVPQVESTYKIARDRNDRAIAGLSMGGLESLTIGLNHSDEFAWIGGFSAAVQKLDFATQLTPPNPKTEDLRLLWIACGTEDGLIRPNRNFVAWLKSKDMPVTAIETPGLHTWLVWRDNISHFAPLLFQPR
ncbi:MAG TPA: alpha/beta hydrolase-fold protein [Acidobacteriaceae bacterium]|nr:alpha/beta hydrolase-fold protein [Acidobacteriaceae bacterium]